MIVKYHEMRSTNGLWVIKMAICVSSMIVRVRVVFRKTVVGE